MEWHSKDMSEVLRDLKTDKQKGLTKKDAEERLKEEGYNRLESKKTKPLWKKFLEQFSDFMVIILLIAAGISYATSRFSGDADILEPIIILVIVIINAIMGVIQESKAEKAIEALQKLSAPTVRVIRDSEYCVIKAEDIVPGDIMVLEAGDIVVADARLIDSSGIKTEEASLTGESLPVEKNHQMILSEKTPIGDRKNMIFATTVITYGRGLAVVTDTGMNTQVGQIAKMINNNETPQTPLQKKLEKTGEFLGIAALMICAAIFVMGIIQQENPLNMFMIAISLAVAAIPEGLPAVVTIVLAMGVQKMVRHNAIIRKLPAVETLGSATVICSDKTGTLTQNKMTVTDVCNLYGNLEFGSQQGKKILSMSTLCNNSVVNIQSTGCRVEGDPTETAIVEAFHKVGKDKLSLDRENLRVLEFPFDSDRKLMTTVHKDYDGRYIVITKGAPEMLIKRCANYEQNGNAQRITQEKIKQIEMINNQMSMKALRVLAVAYKYVNAIPNKESVLETENNLTFLGLIGMIDPPRPEVEQAVQICRRAGIKPVMITGDHIVTASAIAKQIGILKGNDKAITGEELDKISIPDFERSVNNYSVFARVSPEHKARIVKAFQRNGHVVAMTGDGVNDAPALKIADIGCAMGITGTDVAKGASDMILTDDNFASIVEAVREGRGIYQNIKKAIHFLLSSNIGEIITIFIAFFFKMPTPLLPIQLLWVNLITDSLPALALGVDTIDKDIMNKKPISAKKSLFSDGLGLEIITQGIMIGALALIAFTLGIKFFDVGQTNPAIGRTMAFCVLSLSQLVHAFNTRSDKSLFKIGIFSNKYLVGSFALCALLQVVVVSIAPIAEIFKVVPLNLMQWGIVATLSIAPFIIVEIVKKLTKIPNR